MPHKQPQACDNGCCNSPGCPEHGDLPPSVICQIPQDGLTFTYSIERADSATLQISCPGEDPVVYDLTELLVDGAYSGSESYDDECFYTVCAINGCAQVCCSSECDDIVLELGAENDVSSFCQNGPWNFTWEYSIGPGFTDTLRYGHIKLYRQGNSVETINLDTGMFNDSGIVEVECGSPWVETIEVYVETTCGRWKREWVWLPFCVWLADRVEVEIADMDDIDYSCSFTGSVGGGGVTITNVDHTITTTGFSALNGVHEFEIDCSQMVEESIVVGEVTIDYDRVELSEVSFGGPLTKYRETWTSDFSGNLVIRAIGDGCLASLRPSPAFSAAPYDQTIRLELQGEVTISYLLEDVTNPSSPVVLSTSGLVRSCDGEVIWEPLESPSGGAEPDCPRVYFEDRRDAACSISLTQDNLPNLNYTMEEWSTTTGITLWHKFHGGTPLACYPIVPIAFTDATARIRYLERP